jgi:hypothetical protein
MVEGKRASLRRTQVCLLASWQVFPAFVAASGQHRPREVVPLFTRQTARRVVTAYMQADSTREALGEFPSGERRRASWEGSTLLFQVGSDTPIRIEPDEHGLYRILGFGDVSSRAAREGDFTFVISDQWVEFLPPWPTGRKITAQVVIDLLEVEVPDVTPLFRRIAETVPAAVLLEALAMAKSADTRRRLLILLAEGARSIAPQVAQHLRRRSKGERSAAAWALEELAIPDVGARLFEAAQRESDDGVRQGMILALGTLRYRGATRWLIDIVSDASKSDTTRGTAAASLGALGAGEATVALKRALAETDHQPDSYLVDRAKWALHEIAAPRS